MRPPPSTPQFGIERDDVTTEKEMQRKELQGEDKSLARSADEEVRPHAAQLARGGLPCPLPPPPPPPGLNCLSSLSPQGLV